MTELRDLVDAYKREVAVPGTFATAFPNTTDDDIAAALADAFAEAQLDGFFSKVSLDVDAGEVTPDLSVAGAALVVLYAGMRMIRQQIRSASSEKRYWAGPVGMQEKQSASALSEDLKWLSRRRDELLANARNRGTQVFVLEGYVSRGAAHNLYGGMFDYEMPGTTLGIY